MKKLLIPCIALALATAASLQAKPSAEGSERQEPPPEAGCDAHRPPPPPLMMALDTNHDGVISAEELANATKSLLALDRNADGQLDQEELRPPRPEGAPDEDAPPPLRRK